MSQVFIFAACFIYKLQNSDLMRVLISCVGRVISCTDRGLSWLSSIRSSSSSPQITSHYTWLLPSTAFPIHEQSQYIVMIYS